MFISMETTHPLSRLIAMAIVPGLYAHARPKMREICERSQFRGRSLIITRGGSLISGKVSAQIL